MIALLQRVTHAQVVVEQNIVGKIDQGILALIGIEKNDCEKKAIRLIERILGYRIFSDPMGKMNLNLSDIHGGLLCVPQFTLAADTRKGMRPSFSTAASPDDAKQLFDYFIKQTGNRYQKLQKGIFAADMQVSLCNDGPVTFWLQT